MQNYFLSLIGFSIRYYQNYGLSVMVWVNYGSLILYFAK